MVDETSPLILEQDNWKIDASDIKKGKCIGNGKFGNVYEAEWLGIKVAIKQIISTMKEINLSEPKIKVGKSNEMSQLSSSYVKTESEESVRSFIDEIRMLTSLRHQSVVRFYGACIDSPNFYIVMEYVENGTLSNMLYDQKNEIRWEQQLGFALDIACGMRYLHSKHPPIIHRDLKSMNLLVSNDMKIKICDFGLAEMKKETLTSIVGTPRWSAPEIFIGENRISPYTEKSDVYSFGIILWEIVAREVPYNHLKPNEIIKEVVEKGVRPPLPINLNKDYENLMCACWDTNPKVRPSFY